MQTQQVGGNGSHTAPGSQPQTQPLSVAEFRRHQERTENPERSITAVLTMGERSFQLTGEIHTRCTPDDGTTRDVVFETPRAGETNWPFVEMLVKKPLAVFFELGGQRYHYSSDRVEFVELVKTPPSKPSNAAAFPEAEPCAEFDRNIEGAVAPLNLQGFSEDHVERAVSYLMLGAVAVGKSLTNGVSDREFPEFLRSEVFHRGNELAGALIEAVDKAGADTARPELQALACRPGGNLYSATRAVCAELVKLGETLSGQLKGNGAALKVCDAFDFKLPLVFLHEAERLHEGLIRCAQQQAPQAAAA